MLREGAIQAGDTLRLLERNPEKVSIWDFFDLKMRKYADRPLLTRLLRIKGLNEQWREVFQKQLAP